MKLFVAFPLRLYKDCANWVPALEGDEYELEGDGLLARCICHEVDHLEGHMYTDFAEPGSVISNEELAKQQKEAQEEGKEEN